MPVENNATRRSPPKTTTSNETVDIAMMTTPPTKSPRRKNRNQRSMMILPIPILAIFLLWLCLILFSYSHVNVNQWHAVVNQERTYLSKNSTQLLQQQKVPKKTPAMRIQSISIKQTPILVSSESEEKTPILVSSDSEETEYVSNDDYEEEEPLDIVHVIHTRFMQQQPSLVDLGLARLKLFQAIFLRSLEQQSSSNFLCLIRTDPELDPRILQRLVHILKNSTLSRYLLIASTDNPSFQYHDLTTNYTNDQVILSGNWKDAQEYLQGNKSGRFLESRLDADDGLHTLFVETIQQDAQDSFDFAKSTWRIWCAGRHLEWQYQTAWKEDNQNGSLVTLRFGGCITAGLTTGYSGTSDIESLTFPTTKHQSLHKTVPKCHRDGFHQSNCFSFLRLMPTALRARTPTSAGMLNILWGNHTSTSEMNKQYTKGASKQHRVQDQLWVVAEKLFGFSKETARGLHKYLEENMLEIATDNLKGQCTDGHSCKISSQELLQAIVGSSK